MRRISCQAFSVAGKRQGFEDARGTLFFEIARLVKARRPPYLLLENVPGLLSHNKGATFNTILYTLYELGYHVEWQVLNSKVSESLSPEKECILSDILMKDVPEKYYLSPEQTRRLLFKSSQAAKGAEFIPKTD